MKMIKKELNEFMRVGLAPLFNQYGFTRWSSGSQGGGFRKQVGSSHFIIRYAFLTYDIYRFGSDINVFITYAELEEILGEILAKNHLHGFDKKQIYEYRSTMLGYSNRKNHNKDDIDVFYKSDLEPLIEMYKKSFIEDALPFFEAFSDLNKFYHFIKDETDEEQLQNLLCTIYPKFKLLVIYRLCNDDRYETLMLSQYKGIKDAISQFPEHTELQKYWGTIRDLKQVLDKTKPIYNI